MLEIYTVTFVGHRYIDNPYRVEVKLEDLFDELFHAHEYIDFLVGREGDFDQIVTSAIRFAKRDGHTYDNSLIWVMPYETAFYRNNLKSLYDYYDEIELCSEAASGHFRGAIQKRNRYMVDCADLLVCYVENDYGGAYQTMQYAIKCGKKVINLSERQNF